MYPRKPFGIHVERLRSSGRKTAETCLPPSRHQQETNVSTAAQQEKMFIQKSKRIDTCLVVVWDSEGSLKTPSGRSNQFRTSLPWQTLEPPSVKFATSARRSSLLLATCSSCCRQITVAAVGSYLCANVLGQRRPRTFFPGGLGAAEYSTPRLILFAEESTSDSSSKGNKMTTTSSTELILVVTRNRIYTITVFLSTSISIRRNYSQQPPRKL